MKKYLRHNMSVFQKVEWLKRLSSEAIGVSDNEVLTHMLSRLRRKGTAEFRKYGVLRLSQNELILDQLLKGNKVSPKTAYIWFLLMRAPKMDLESGDEEGLSQNELLRRCAGRLRMSPEKEKLGKEIIRDIIKLMEVI